MSEYIIGIDIGTGSVKAVALSAEGLTLGSAAKSYPVDEKKGDRQEQDPQMVFDAFCACIQTLVEQMQGPPRIIGLSSAMHSLMAVDEKGKVLLSLMLWSDLRSVQQAVEARMSEDTRQIYLRTGTPLHAMSPLCKLRWLAAEKPELIHESFKLISIKEYCWFRLTGFFEVDYSIASATGLFDIHRLQWDETALQWAGVTEDQLSEPRPTNFSRKINEPAILSLLKGEEVELCIGASDGCLAVLGTDGLKPAQASLTIGTSAAVRMASSHSLADLETMPFSYLLDELTFINGYPLNNGGNIMNWLAATFAGNEKTGVEKVLEDAASVPAGSEGLICLPYLQGERAPVWDEESTGLFFGVKSTHRLPHFQRAAIEGVCYCLKQILLLLEQKSEKIELVHLSGGFTRSSFWVQMLCDILNRDVSLTQEEDASALGAGLLALASWQGKDLKTLTESRSKLQDSGIIHPGQDAEIYEKNFQTFIKLYPSTKAVIHSR